MPELALDHGNRKYPWEDWADGQVRLVNLDEISCKPASFRAMAVTAFNARGMRCRARIRPEGIYLQAVPRDA